MTHLTEAQRFSTTITRSAGLRALKGLFEAERMNPANPMNQPGRAMGKHIAARIARAKARRRKGRVVKGLRHKAGRATFSLG